MKDLLIKNKIKIATLLLISLLGVSLYFIGNIFVSLRFFILVPIAILLGLGFTALFKTVFPIKNIITFFSISLFLGLFLNTIVIFILGSMGLVLNECMILTCSAVSLLLNNFLFLKFLGEQELRGYIKSIKLELVDSIFFLLLLLLIIPMVNICLEAYFPLWDSFTFWAVDAKYIYENSHFRDSNFVFLANNYLSFFPLQIHFVYLLYGKIVEQTASLLSILYAFTGGMIVYSYILDLKRTAIKKSLLYLSVFAAIYSFYLIHFLIFSIYADLFTAVIALVYIILIFNDNWEIADYWKRLILITLLSVSIYFTKTHFLVFTILLLLFFLFYDRKVLLDKFRNIKECHKEILAILSIISIIIVVGLYAKTISNETQFIVGTVKQITMGTSIARNILNVGYQFITRIPLFVLTIIILFVHFFFQSGGIQTKESYKIFFILLIVSFPSALYICGVFPFEDSSLLRYAGLSYFLIPYIFISIFPDVNIKIKWQRMLAVLIIFLSQALITYKVFYETGFDLNFSPSSGSYKDFSTRDNSGINRDFATHSDVYSLSEKIKQIIPSDSSLFLVTYDHLNKLVTDNFPPVFFMRYYLIEYNKVGSFACEPELCPGLYVSSDIDYLVVYSYQNYWPLCDEVLKKDTTYLINLNVLDYEEGQCLAEDGNYIILE